MTPITEPKADSTLRLNFNGRILPTDEPLFSARERLVRYGDGLFETLLLHDGEAPLLELHLERLRRGMEFLGLEGFPADDPTFVLRQLRKTTSMSGSWRIRLLVFRRGTGLYAPTEDACGFLVEARKTNPPPAELPERGLRAGLFQSAANSCQRLSNFKTCNALVQVLAGRHCRQERLDTCFVLNDRGTLSCALAANVFLVKNGQLYTPALSEGCVDGIMRRVVLQCAAGLGLDTHEHPLQLDWLETADEIFVTNAVQGIRWVKRYHNYQYGREVSGQLHRKVLERLGRPAEG